MNTASVLSRWMACRLGPAERTRVRVRSSFMERAKYIARSILENPEMTVAESAGGLTKLGELRYEAVDAALVRSRRKPSSRSRIRSSTCSSPAWIRSVGPGCVQRGLVRSFSGYTGIIRLSKPPQL